MDILQSFVLDGTNYEVNILWKDEKPLFRASEIGNILDIKNVHSAISGFDNTEKEVIVSNDNVGKAQNITFLTEDGVYTILMNSRKKNAKPFKKWVCRVLIEIRETGKYELKKEIDKIKEESDIYKIDNDEKFNLLKIEADKYKKQVENAEHNALLNAYHKKYIVYFGKIKYINGKTLVKIGSTKDIKNRIIDLIKIFGNMEIFRVFECATNEKFEKDLHKHDYIVQFAYKDLIVDTKSTEVFLMNTDEIHKAINIATVNVHKYKQDGYIEKLIEKDLINLEAEKVKLEIEKTKFERQKMLLNADSDEIVEDNIILSNDENIETFEHIPIDPTILFADNRSHTQTKGSKVQRYSEDTKVLLKTYDSAISALRDPELDAPSRPMINESAKKNTLYKGFRWALLDREFPDDTFQILDSTVDSKIVHKGFVAMLNLNKDKIIKVYCDQKEAGIDRHFTSSASIANAIKRESKSSGHYFKMWFNCSQELKDEYLSRETLPSLRVASNGKQIQKLHPITKEILQVYSSVNDVVKDYQIGRGTLYKAIESNIIKKGYFWKFVN
jgi:prophage antirepressor-like protein